MSQSRQLDWLLLRSTFSFTRVSTIFLVVKNQRRGTI